MSDPRAPRGDGDAGGMPEAPPPFLGSWRRIYAVVLIELAVLIVLFYGFTRAFR